jgi:hypothetical protein
MPATRSSSKSAGPAVPLRLLMPVLGAGVLVACIAVMIGGGGERQSVSEVMRQIHQKALAGNEPDAPYGAGRIGAWKIAAERVNPLTGELTSLRIQSGAMLVAARTAHVVVDPEADTFSFELHGVVYTRVPRDGEEVDGAFVHELDHYVLGPAPYGVDIVPDQPGTTVRSGDTSRLSRAGLDDDRE